MKKITDLLAFYIMSAVGGIFGGYTVISVGILGAAQSMNLITLIMGIFGRDIKQILIRAGFLAVFAVGTIATRIIKERCKIDVRTVSIIVDIICTAVVAAIPDTVDAMIVLYPIIFAMAFQYNSFTGALGFASSSVFSSNNFRQFTDSAAEYFCTKKQEAKRKCLFFAGSLLFFHIGVTVAVVGMALCGKIFVTAAILPIAAALVLVCRSHKLADEKCSE